MFSQLEVWHRLKFSCWLQTSQHSHWALLIWEIWWQGQGKNMRRPIFQHIRLYIYTLGHLLLYNNTTLYHWVFFFLLTMSLFLFKCEKGIYNTNVLKAGMFLYSDAYLCLWATDTDPHVPLYYELSQAEQHQIVSGMISLSYVTLVSKHWQSLAVWHHLCLDGNYKGEGGRLYLKANVL